MHREVQVPRKAGCRKRRCGSDGPTGTAAPDILSLRGTHTSMYIVGTVALARPVLRDIRTSCPSSGSAGIRGSDGPLIPLPTVRLARRKTTNHWVIPSPNPAPSAKFTYIPYGNKRQRRRVAKREHESRSRGIGVFLPIRPGELFSSSYRLRLIHRLIYK